MMWARELNDDGSERLRANYSDDPDEVLEWGAAAVVRWQDLGELVLHIETL